MEIIDYLQNEISNQMEIEEIQMFIRKNWYDPQYDENEDDEKKLDNDSVGIGIGNMLHKTVHKKYVDKNKFISFT